MTVDHPQKSDEIHQGTVSYDDDVIDLRIYVDVMIRWWQVILLCGLLGAVAGGGLIFLRQSAQAPTYEASAIAIMARVTNDVTLDERFQTLSDENVQIDASRRASLVGLVNSGAIAAAVAAELGDQLPAAWRSPAALLNHVEANAIPSADSRTPSDLIRITASANSPETAAAIANSWLHYYVEEANALYGQVPAEVYDAVVAERAKASANFVAAQEMLESFISESPIETYTRQIAERKALVDFLNQAQVEAGISALTQDVNLRIALFESLSAAESEPALALLQEQTRQQVQSITDLFADRTRARRHLIQARALQAQIEAGGDAAAASNAVALQLLKTQIFANDDITTPEPVNLDSNVPEPDGAPLPEPTIPQPNPPLQWSIDGNTLAATAEAQLQDVTALVASLESYIVDLDAALAEAGRAAGNGDGYLFLDQFTADHFALAADETAVPSDDAAIDQLRAAILASYADLFQTGELAQLELPSAAVGKMTRESKIITELEDEIRLLSAQLAAEQARERQLAQQRDLAWNAYDTLSNKVVELDLERTAANREVRAGTEATPPLNPTPSRSPVTAAAVGGVIGLLFGIFMAFLMDYLGRQPLPPRRSTAS